MSNANKSKMGLMLLSLLLLPAFCVQTAPADEEATDGSRNYALLVGCTRYPNLPNLIS